MSYISVHSIKTNGNPGSFYIVGTVISSGNTEAGIELFADDDATPEAINLAIAEAARQVCRANAENIAIDAPVMIFGVAAQVI